MRGSPLSNIPTATPSSLGKPSAAPSSISELHTALHEAVSCHAVSFQMPPAEANRLWYSIANLLRESVCELAAEAPSGKAPCTEAVHTPRLREGQALCEMLAARLKSEVPPLYAVVKHSLKRNGDLRTHRACERTVAELGLLVGTHAVLLEYERDALLLAARPLVTVVSTGRRLPSLVLLCRGFFSPGYAGIGGWRSRKPGGMTVFALAQPWRGAVATDEFSLRLAASGSELQRHSRVLRAALPFLELPRRVWHRSVPGSTYGEDIDDFGTRSALADAPDGCDAAPAVEAALGAGDAAANLLFALVAEGPAGVDAVRTLREWSCGALESRWSDETSGPSAATPPLSRASPAAVCVCQCHGALVKGRRPGRSTWVSTVLRVGHLIQLMVQLAQSRNGARGAASEPSRTSVATLAEEVTGLTLAYSLLDRSASTRPRLEALMAQPGLTPHALWELVDETLFGDTFGGAGLGGAGLGGAGLGGTVLHSEEAGRGSEHSRESPAAPDHPDQCFSRALLRLRAWRRPHLLFDYLAIHQALDETSRPPECAGDAASLSPLVQRWLRALLRLPDHAAAAVGVDQIDSLHQLRCGAAPNRAHFERMAATSDEARRAVLAWVAADLADCELSSATGARPSVGGEARCGSGLPGTCSAEDMFMLGEELQTCLRIAPDCGRENAAILSVVAQGNARLLVVAGGLGEVGGLGVAGSSRVAMRAVVRLLARSDTGAPVLFVDQPLVAGHTRSISATRCLFSAARSLFSATRSLFLSHALYF